VLTAAFLFLLKLSPLVLTPPDKTQRVGVGEGVAVTGHPTALARVTVASLPSFSSDTPAEGSDAEEAVPPVSPSSFWAGNVYRYLSCVLALLQRFSLLANWPDSEGRKAEEEEGPFSLYIR
jgi:hypothetical protein